MIPSAAPKTPKSHVVKSKKNRDELKLNFISDFVTAWNIQGKKPTKSFKISQSTASY